MISLKRNGKKELVPATGVTSQKWRIYSSNQNKDFVVSRSRFDEYMDCPRCFYLKTNKGLMSPSTPGWTLNTLTDTLLKKTLILGCPFIIWASFIWKKNNLN